jgi:lysophospholipase L1-like esterase
MDTHFQPDLVFIMLNKNDFRTLAKSPKKLVMVAKGTTETLVKPDNQTFIEDMINDLGYRSFFGKLQAQTYGFLYTKNATQTEPPTDNDSHLTKQAISIQLAALQKDWGERLVVIYKVSVPDFGKDAPPTYDDEVLHQLRALDIPIINLYEPMLNAFQKKKPPTGFNNSILGQGHYNQYGHQLIAREILKYLEVSR